MRRSTILIAGIKMAQRFERLDATLRGFLGGKR